MHELKLNAAIWIPLIVWTIVQSFKFIFDLIEHKRINIQRIWGSGGMPSAHSALVCSLATVVGLREGVGSTLFAMSLIFSLVVMYDAAGVRRAAGKQARVLNQIIEGDKDINIPEKLTELLGHTPKEVIVGALVGIFLSMILYRNMFI